MLAELVLIAIRVDHDVAREGGKSASDAMPEDHGHGTSSKKVEHAQHKLYFQLSTFPTAGTTDQLASVR